MCNPIEWIADCVDWVTSRMAGTAPPPPRRREDPELLAAAERLSRNIEEILEDLRRKKRDQAR